MKKCQMCQKLFPNNSKLKRHMAVHNKIKSLRLDCKICSKYFKCQRSLNEHILRHSSRRNFKCDTCGRCFKTPTGVIIHKKIHSDTRTRRFKCDKCPSRFFTKQHEKNHQSIHSNEKPFACTVCDVSYATNRSLKDHMIWAHSSDKRFECKFCFKRLGSTQSLIYHIQSHTGENRERLIKCELCNKFYVTLTALKFHKIQYHSENPMFVCKLCSKAYRSKSGLRGHVNWIHKNVDTEKRIPCTLCDKLFLTNGRLTSHMHSHTRPHKCPMCSQTFESKANVNLHIRRIHVKEKLGKCYFCGNFVFSVNELSSHLRIHTKEKPFKCDLCDQIFGSENSGRYHKKAHHKDPNPTTFKCMFCPKVFEFQRNLSTHMKRHLNERPFKCTLCEGSFVLKAELALHSKSGLCIVRIQKRKELSRGCYFCGKFFRGSWEQSVHLISVHTNEKPFKCCRCKKIFNYSSVCASHTKTCRITLNKFSMK